MILPIFAAQKLQPNPKPLIFMCTVDKKTITLVNSRMIERVKAHRLPAQCVGDRQIVIPVHLLGSRSYRMSVDRVNEIYGRAREKVVSVSGHREK